MKGMTSILDLMLFSLLVSAACLYLHSSPPIREERVASSFGSHLALALQSITLDSLEVKGGWRYKPLLGMLTEEAVVGEEEVGKRLENSLRKLCEGKWACVLRVEVLRPHQRTVLLELSTSKRRGKRVYSTLLHRTLPPPEVGRVEMRLELWSP